MRIIVLIFLAVFLFANAAQAQDYAVGKGSFIVSGDFRINSVLGDAEHRSLASYLHFSPRLMYFPISNLALGIQVAYEDIRFFESDIEGLAIGPAAVFYIGGKDKDWFPFIEAAFHVLDFEFEEAGTVTGSGHQFMLGAGYLSFLTDHAAIQGGIQYYFQNAELDDTGQSENGKALAIFAGLSYFLY